MTLPVRGAAVEAIALRRLRATAQLLHRPEPLGPAQLVSRLLGVQAQELRSARLALRARAEGLTAAAIDAALTGERSLVIAWLQRGTLHLVAREDLAWLLSLTAPAGLARTRRRLGHEGVSPAAADRAVAVVGAALAADGPLTRAELARRLAARGIRTEGQATPHLLALAVLEGVAVLGPLRDGAPAFAHARDWLGEDPPAAGLGGDRRDKALAELARRYLTAHAPATPADLARWAGLPLRDARRGLERIAAELHEHADGLLSLTGTALPDAAVPERLLAAFDPYLLGWADRSFAVPERHARRVHPGGGILRATATADGLAVGTWTVRGIEPFARLTAHVADALDEERREVDRFVAGC